MSTDTIFNILESKACPPNSQRNADKFADLDAVQSFYVYRSRIVFVFFNIEGDLRAAIPVKVGATHGSAGRAIVPSIISRLQPRSQTISSSKASIEIQAHPIAQVASSSVITHSLFNSLFYFWAIDQQHKPNAYIKSHEYKLKLAKLLFNQPSF